ncbi:DsbA family protein [Vibrio atypicus]|uniref:DsbA family protein n=1 Tax=Vibrio atypicus TaxID=558271 RepID=UPI00135B9744|nr:DsbA family protein [Vibrio atypicus]
MFKKITLVSALSLVMLAPTAFAETQQQKIDAIVDMLQDNPEVVDTLHESLAAYIVQQQQFKEVVASSQNYIKNPNHTFMGAENPELTLINVTDYSCPYCKKLDVELEKLVKAFPQIKVVNLYVPLKEGISDLNSASFALNVWKNDKEKYQKVHELLVKKPGSHNPMSLAMVAKKTGTEQYLKADKAIEQQLAENYALFNGFGLRGTPALIIGEEVIPGYVPYDQLEKVLEEKLTQ